MAALIYSLCALMALLCAWQLLQAWRRTRYRLLFWSGLCFVGLTANNILLVVDKILLPETDMAIMRSVTALLALLILLYGLIWNTE